MNNPDKALAGVCGLYCGCCPIYRAYKDGYENFLKIIAATVGVDKVACEGCRSEKCWRENCFFKECAYGRGLDFCFECPEYPCGRLLEFSEMVSHRQVIFENAERIQEVGWEKWLKEEDVRWRCPYCGSRISYYNVKCPSCGGKLNSV
ncbi:MAG: DUF3795 domain-containing protein [Thermoprotei archaeon]|nr:MAG: DUF3795 domain-containing protein [Thermoprotei archaeon]